MKETLFRTYNSGMEFLKKKKYEFAEDEFKKLLGTKYEAQALFNLGKIATIKEETENVRYYYGRLKNIDSKYKYFALENWAIYELNSGNYNTARSVYEAILNDDKAPHKTAAHLGLARVDARIGKKNNARKKFEESMFLHNVMNSNNSKRNDDLYTLLCYGNFEYDCGNYDAAIGKYSIFINRTDRFGVYAHSGIGIAKAGKGNYDLALEYLNTGLNMALGLKDISKEEIARIVKCIVELEIVIGNIDVARALIAKYERLFAGTDKTKFLDYIGLYIDKSYTDDKIKRVYDSRINHILYGHSNEFNEGIDIESMFYNAIEILKNSDLKNKICSEQEYFISFDDYIGTIDGEKTKCMKVIYFIDKTNIITMYPVIWYGETLNGDQKVKKYIYK